MGKLYKPRIGLASKVKVDKSKLKSGCVVEAGDDEILFVVGHIAPQYSASEEEEVRLKNKSGVRCGVANISAVTVID